MGSIFRTVTAGVRSLLRICVSLSISVVLIAATAAVITFPLWFLSSRAPTIFTIAVGVIALGGILAFAVARVRRIIRESGGSLSVWDVAVRPTLSIAWRSVLLLGAVYLTLAAFLGRDPLLGVIGGVVTVALLIVLLGRRAHA